MTSMTRSSHGEKHHPLEKAVLWASQLLRLKGYVGYRNILRLHFAMLLKGKIKRNLGKTCGIKAPF